MASVRRSWSATATRSSRRSALPTEPGGAPDSGARDRDPLRRGHASRIPRPVWAALAYVFAGLGLIGLVLPGVPTTPFVLLAAWSASHGSDRLHRWLHDHPRLGPVLVAWERERAVATRAKLLALAFLAASWAIMAWRGAPGIVLALLGALFVAVGAFVATRPAPRGS